MTFQFGDFELDTSSYQLRRGTRPVKLEKLPMELLMLLVNRAGELVTRREIVHTMWGGDVFVDAEPAINTAVRKVRHALGDDAEHPHCVETVVGKGYRFVAAVVVTDVTMGAAPVAHWIFFNGRTLGLHEGEYVIGRDVDVAVSLPSPTVSRRHARLVITGRTATLEDLKSKNGTFVRGDVVRSPTILDDGDQIRIGAFQLTYRSATSLGSTEMDPL